MVISREADGLQSLESVHSECNCSTTYCLCWLFSISLLSHSSPSLSVTYKLHYSGFLLGQPMRGTGRLEGRGGEGFGYFFPPASLGLLWEHYSFPLPLSPGGGNGFLVGLHLLGFLECVCVHFFVFAERDPCNQIAYLNTPHQRQNLGGE